MVQPDSGEVNLFDKQYPQQEVAFKRKIGYVPETSEIQ
jgi:ABC-type multidrug transport system ATPase subunit